MKIAVAFLLSAGVVFAQTSASPGYPAYQKAAAMFDKAQYQEALTEVDRALGLDPKLAPALILKAKLAISINRYDVADESLHRALAADPASWYAQFLLGFLYYRQNQMPQAKAELEKARRLNPSDPRAALYLGLTEETLGHLEDASRLYRDAIRLEEASGKPHAEAWITYARLLTVNGDLPGAEKLIERALKIEPNSRDAHFEHGRLLFKKGLSEEAAKEGESALRLQGEVTDRQVHFLLVQAYRAAGREKEAEQHAEAIRAAERN
jgi:tetratricopeptide (TPR) repeat protein